MAAVSFASASLLLLRAGVMGLGAGGSVAIPGLIERVTDELLLIFVFLPNSASAGAFSVLSGQSALQLIRENTPTLQIAGRTVSLGREFEPIRNFLHSPDCRVALCSVDPPMLWGARQQIERDYQRERHAIDQQAPENSLEVISGRSALLLARAEIPRAEAILALTQAHLQFLSALRSELER